MVLCVGSPHPPFPLPDRWAKWFSRIEVHWASEERIEVYGDGAQGQELYRLIDPTADVSITCDADSLLIRPLPEDFLDQLSKSPAVCGVMAHFPPPLVAYPWLPDPGISNHLELWQRIAQKVLQRDIRLQTPYSMGKPDQLGPSFYINHAFLAGPPQLLRRLGDSLDEVRLGVRSVLNNDFYEQMALTYAAELGGIAHRQLPMRFNFPNDPMADERFPDEMNNIVLLHYLRTNLFDRHKIFANEEDFTRFLALPLSGSNAIFRSYIADITGSSYPFKSGDQDAASGDGVDGVA